MESSQVQAFSIVALSIAACIVYGVIHDQITARICVEYFTIGHPIIIPTNDPTTLGFLWGVIATWWVGAILGIMLAIAARVGSCPKRSATSLVKPILILLGTAGTFATIAGIAGYVAASNEWVWLVGSIADRVPSESHVAFLVDIWIHSASYLVAFVGGIILIVLVWRSRIHLTTENAS